MTFQNYSDDVRYCDSLFKLVLILLPFDEWPFFAQLAVDYFKNSLHKPKKKLKISIRMLTHKIIHIQENACDFNSMKSFSFNLLFFLWLHQINYNFHCYMCSKSKLMAMRQSLNDMNWRPPPLQVINVSTLCSHALIFRFCVICIIIFSDKFVDCYPFPP